MKLVGGIFSKSKLFVVRKVWYRGAVSGLLLGAVLSVAACGGGGPPEPTPTPSSAVDGVISIKLKNSEFQPVQLRFSTGETVKFLLNSTDEIHTFTVEDLGFSWTVPRAAKPLEKEFTFNKPGRYELVCVISGHKAAGMVGEIIID